MRSGAYEANDTSAPRQVPRGAVRPLGAVLGSVLLALVFACGGEAAPATPAGRLAADAPTSAATPTPLATISLSYTIPGERYPSQGNAHIPLDQAHPPYNSTPATSGWHYAVPLAPVPWGLYENPLPDEVLLHNLEHGGIGVHYDCPEGCPDLVDDIVAAILSQPRTKILVSPYPAMPTRIALTAWNYLDAFDVFDEDRIVAFIEAHESSPNAPEFNVP